MAITKITKNAFPASIDLSSVDLTIGNDEIVTANISDTYNSINDVVWPTPPS